MEFLKALQTRRSVYALGNHPVVSDEILESTLKDVIEATPSAFNSQSQRTVLLLRDRHLQLWNIVLDALKKIVPEKQFSKTQAKLHGFASAYGTLLFFDDQKITQGLMKEYPLYKDNFAVWYQQHGGILQGNVWTALATLGYGASLQHYNELIVEEVKKAFDLPATWQLLAQMPFGNILQAPEAKEKEPITTKFVVRR